MGKKKRAARAAAKRAKPTSLVVHPKQLAAIDLVAHAVAQKEGAISKSGKRPRIGKSGPPLLVVVPMPDGASTLVAHEALNAEPQEWFRIMERADIGDTGSMIDMFSDSRDRDEHLDGVARKRAQSMMGRPIAFRPADGLEDDKEALQVARDVRRILLFESLKFRSMLTHLMQGSVDGYAVSPIRWATNGNGESVPHLQWAHANRFAYTFDTLELGFYTDRFRGHRNVKPLADHPDAFVAHEPMGGRSDYPWRRGPMRSAIIPSFIKRNGLKFWMTLAERFGMPQIFATVPQGEDHDGNSQSDVIGTVEKSLKNMNRIWSLVVSEGIDLKAVEGSTGNITGEVHQKLIGWAETTQSIGMLGQNLSTKVEGGSFAAAESHRFVADDLHLADSVELSETITQQLCERIVRFNWPGAPVPICEISVAQKAVFTNEDVRDGVASPDERRRTMGHDAQPNGEGAEIRRPASVSVVANITPGDDEPDAEPDPKVEPEATPEPVEPVGNDEVPPPGDQTSTTAAKGGFPLIGQITAMQAIVAQVVKGELNVETGIKELALALPITTAEARLLLSDVEPAADPAPIPDMFPAPEGDDDGT